MQRLVQRRRNRKIRKFHQQIIFLIQRIAVRIEANIFEILITQMKVAAGRQNQAAFKTRLQLIAALLDFHGIEDMIRVRVRRPDHVRDAVRDRHLRHGDRHLKRIRPVIEARKNVAMNVDHSRENSSACRG